MRRHIRETLRRILPKASSREARAAIVAGGCFLVVLIAMLSFAKLERVRGGIYRYDVRSDYVYDFRDVDGIVTVEIQDGKLVLPPQASQYETAYLEVGVRASLLGRLLDPYIEIVAGDNSYVQYTERGADGVRYLDISGILKNGTAELVLEAHHIRIDEGPAELVLFDNAEYLDKRFLILATHPDDAEIAAYGLYSTVDDVHVVTVTAGNAGSMNYDELYASPEEHYLKKGELRVWNSVTTPILAGVEPERSLNLGYFDGVLATMYHAPTEQVPPLYREGADIDHYRSLNISTFLESTPAQSTWESLVRDMRNLVLQIEPEVVVTPYPAIDSHPDHKLTTAALIEALELGHGGVESLWLYTNHLVASESYPFGKAWSNMPLPPNHNPDFLIGEVVSIELDRSKQKSKMLALETMNDLRLDTEWTTTGGAFEVFLQSFVTQIKGRDMTYFRRAVRSNELFFKFDAGQVLGDASVQSSILGELPANPSVIEPEDASNGY